MPRVEDERRTTSDVLWADIHDVDVEVGGGDRCVVSLSFTCADHREHRQVADLVRHALSDELHLRDVLARAGVTVLPRQVIDALEDAIALVVESEGRSGLSAVERKALRADGIDPDAEQAGPSPSVRTAAEFAALALESFDVKEAAAALGVDESRVRQRLAERTLFGFKRDGTWRVPRFQLVEPARGRRGGWRVVPGLAAVVKALPADVHPVAVHRWLTQPDPNLALGDEPISPLDWLRTGGDVDAVVRLTADV